MQKVNCSRMFFHENLVVGELDRREGSSLGRRACCFEITPQNECAQHECAPDKKFDNPAVHSVHVSHLHISDFGCADVQMCNFYSNVQCDNLERNLAHLQQAKSL